MKSSAKIVYLTAGAGGMFCGSCLHDNALAKALHADGWNLMLVPFYTPIRTDEQDVSVDQVFFGGINVYLQQKIPLFRYLPSLFDRVLDNPKLIRRVTKNAIETDAKMLGSLALSMLKGAQGKQRKEVQRVCKWLVGEKPDLIVISNILVAGFVPALKMQLDVPVLVTLQGDDLFLDGLTDEYRSKCIAQIEQIAKHVDGFIVHSNYFADYMCEYFDLARDRFHVTPLGLDVADFQQFLKRHDSGGVDDQRDATRTIGYLARLAPEKGLHNLVEAFVWLKQQPNTEHIKLRIAGWLGKQNEAYAEQQWKVLTDAGLGEEFEYLGSLERAEKLKMLGEIDVLSVPTDQKEPKGLFVLEAMAAGVPVVQPDHGSFPEMIEHTRGGLIYPTGDNQQLAQLLLQLLSDDRMRIELARQGQRSVHETRCEQTMAETTGEVFARRLK